MELLGQSPQVCAAGAWTVTQWLRYWLTTRASIRPTTRRSYTEHCEQYLIPELGQVRLDRLELGQLPAAFTRLGTRTNRYGNPLAAATLHQIRATLRAALNAAVREGLLTDNPARRLELPPARRPHAVVRTAPQAQAWKRDGSREPVTVWTVEQPVVFLDGAERDRLHALWHLIALRGLRRGEAAGLRWCDLDPTGRSRTSPSSAPRSPGKCSSGRPRAAPAAAASPSTSTPLGSCGRTPSGSASNAALPAPSGPTPAMSSPATTAGRSHRPS
ncbi:hypothetical protein [Cryptosporangium japonicum]|uniref:site-specific integrase n=1 Tax=Cryptosporangium japonicum TaxID=80872 RepID=UPI0031DC112B